MEYGRYVIFYNERLNGIAYPEGYEVYSVFTELCEVNIKGKQKKPSVFNLNPVLFYKGLLLCVGVFIILLQRTFGRNCLPKGV